jgi:hypothetical protein
VRAPRLLNTRWRSACLAWGLALSGCGNGCHGADAGAAGRQRGADLVFQGMCDASGAVALEGTRFAVADDEDNVLRVYDGAAGGSPLAASDLSSALDLPYGKKVPEADIEAATRFGEYALWLTSHGLSSHGKYEPARFRFFATHSQPDGSRLTVAGKPYAGLLVDLLEAPQLARFDLASAAQRGPKEEGGLNIEGMTQRADARSVWIGFRNPIPGARALLVPLLNPLSVLLQGARAQFGDPELLDLGGLGVRALALWRGTYLIAAGGIAHEAASRLFSWDGHGAPVEIAVDLARINPEALLARDDSADVLLLSDDGALRIDGRPCKKLDDPRQKSFRGLWVHVPGH